MARIGRMVPLPEFLEQRFAEVVALAQRYRAETLTLFGSAAAGSFDPLRSDVDFLVRFSPMTPAEHADAYFGLLHSLEDVLGRRVDLLEEDAVDNPYLMESINRTRRTLYAA